MSGHGWVTPNPDGSKARCGGPAICPSCATATGTALPAQSDEVAKLKAEVVALVLGNEALVAENAALDRAVRRARLAHQEADEIQAELQAENERLRSELAETVAEYAAERANGFRP